MGLKTGILLVFRGLKFKSDAEIGPKGAFFKALIFALGLILFLPFPPLPSWPGPPPMAEAAAAEKNDPNLQKLADRLSLPDEPVSREGAGILIVQAPGERYRLQFRLIARGPEALRLEIFDPFGRPMLYLVSYQGEIRLFSIPQKKEVPFDLPSSGPWSVFPQIPVREFLKIFWGRVPLFPYDTQQSATLSEKGKESVKFEFRGSVHQEIWITPNPWTLTKSRITSPSREGEIEILFSDFSEASGNRTPMRCDIKDGTGEYAFTLRYETLVSRPDIPDETFKLPEFSDSQPSGKK
ncbi:MAG: DUF4292 domain-containing protein [Deltaproteobacteria bacterium]|nr:DUF4292 domain-containing protein [Deltaproteobacteria bacterium]